MVKSARLLRKQLINNFLINYSRLTVYNASNLAKD